MIDDDAIIEVAARLPNEERLPYIQQACESDQARVGRILEIITSMEADTVASIQNADAAEAEIGEGSSDAAVAPLPPAAPVINPPSIGVSPEQLDAIGKYRIISVLDSGGQAVVYRAVHPNLAKEVVIKLSRGPARPATREALLTEGQVLAQIDHPNLARIHDLDFFERRPYLVMEYIRGRSLRQYGTSRSLLPEETAIIVAKAARAVGVAHPHGVFHLDLKPDNILIDLQGEPRVIDFGIARMRDAWNEGCPESDSIRGTASYMAPEQARGESALIDERTDIFALGGVLFWLLTGRPPFAASDWRAALALSRDANFDRSLLEQPRIPPDLRKICLKAMAHLPRDRFESTEALAQALEVFANRGTLLRRRILLGGGATALTALGVGLMLWPRGDRNPEPQRLSLSCWVRKTGTGEEQSLADAASVSTQTNLVLSCEVPPGREARLYWLASGGKVHEIEEFHQTAPDDHIRSLAVELKPPSGTETLFVVAGSPAPSKEEIERLLGEMSSWPKFNSINTPFQFDPDGVRPLRRLRDPGNVTLLDREARAKLKDLQNILRTNFDLFAGVSLVHRMPSGHP